MVVAPSSVETEGILRAVSTVLARGYLRHLSSQTQLASLRPPSDGSTNGFTNPDTTKGDENEHIGSAR